MVALMEIWFFKTLRICQGPADSKFSTPGLVEGGGWGESYLLFNIYFPFPIPKVTASMFKSQEYRQVN